MNALLIFIVSTSILLAGGCATYLYAELNRERSKRYLAEKTALEARAEMGEWLDTAQAAFIAKGMAMAKVVKLRGETINQAKQIASLMHGDRHCVNGHRYQTGEGVSCPHCAAQEASRECEECGAMAIRVEFGEWRCQACCEVPF